MLFLHEDERHRVWIGLPTDSGSKLLLSEDIDGRNYGSPQTPMGQTLLTLLQRIWENLEVPTLWSIR